MNAHFQRYVLRNPWTAKYVYVDHTSGGYPVEYDDPFRATLFTRKADAIHYTAVMSHRDTDHPVYELLEVQMEMEQAHMPTGEELENYR